MRTVKSASPPRSGITSKPSLLRMRYISRASSEAPRMRWTSEMCRATGARSTRLATTSITPPCNSPPPDSRINSATRSHERAVDSKSAPRSKRCEASVCNPCRRELLRMVTGSHHADSIRTLRVFCVIMVSNPPITPARATGLRASATTRSSGVSLRSTPSSVFSVSPSCARRTIIFPPSSRSRSNACVGLPISHSV